MHEQYLMMALAKADEYLGECFPNPAVGAVIVHQGEVVVREGHQRCGSAHAEQNAIDSFFKQGLIADESTALYVTLEPCNHWGKTPPCTNQILEAGIKQVYFGFSDPNPVVKQNNTKALLQKEGVLCHKIQMDAIDAFYQPYVYWTRCKRPTVTVKIAQSLDGKITAKPNQPYRLTKGPLNALTHQYRKKADAILTTSRTIKADNPRLNARLPHVSLPKTLLILDRRLVLTGEEQVFKMAKSITVFHSETHNPSFSAENVQFIPLAESNGQFDLEQLLEVIGGTIGCHQILVEAGGVLFSQLLKANLVNKALIYQVPLLLGTEGTTVYASTDLYDFLKQAEMSFTSFQQEWLFEFNFSRGDVCLQV